MNGFNAAGYATYKDLPINARINLKGNIFSRGNTVGFMPKCWAFMRTDILLNSLTTPFKIGSLNGNIIFKGYPIDMLRDYRQFKRGAKKRN